MHLTKKRKKEKTKRAKLQDGRINTQSDPPDLFKTKRRKKNMQQPVQPDLVLPSGYKLPKLDFLEVGVFLEAISKY